jgi:hypothetical protein
LIVDVQGDGQTDIVTGGDSSALHAYGPTGAQVAGFPKFHTGWSLWSPSAGDLEGNGTTDLVMLTREGYLFAWHTPGKATANDQWWTYHHDEHHTGRYGVDTRPPGAVRDLAWQQGQTEAAFTAPGDDWYTGTVTRYLVSYDGGTPATVQPSGPAGTRQSVAVPAGTKTLTVQAIDKAGNLGHATVLGSSVSRAPARGTTGGAGAAGAAAGRLAATGPPWTSLPALGLLVFGLLLRRLTPRGSWGRRGARGGPWRRRGRGRARG